MGSPKVRSILTDEIVFREGELGDCAYLIERGRVLIYLSKDETEVALRTLGEGEVFGEMSLIDSFPRSASCRALCDTKLMVVTKEQLLARVQAADPVVRLLMRALLERLRAQNDVLRGKVADTQSKVDPLEAEKKEVLKRIELENRLDHALRSDEFVPFYQPIYHLKTGEMLGCEALIRWFPPDGDMIAPSLFMDVIEQSTLVRLAGRVIIEKCLADFAKLQATHTRSSDFFMSINVSGRQFADETFVTHLEEIRNQWNLKAHQIKLELTERVMLEGPEALAILQQCRDLGYRLAVDDFGTGFSSLQYLASMPLTDLKIDRSFVMNMLKDQKTLSIVKALIHMAHLLDLNLIAEGIESKAEQTLLRKMGVQMGQGFLFSKAIPFGEFKKLPVNQKANKTAKPKAA